MPKNFWVRKVSLISQSPSLNIDSLVQKIDAQREEIITAFMAKYYLDPGEIEQVIEPDIENLGLVWYVRKKESGPRPAPAEKIEKRGKE